MIGKSSDRPAVLDGDDQAPYAAESDRSPSIAEASFTSLKDAGVTRQSQVLLPNRVHEDTDDDKSEHSGKHGGKPTLYTKASSSPLVNPEVVDKAPTALRADMMIIPCDYSEYKTSDDDCELQYKPLVSAKAGLVSSTITTEPSEGGQLVSDMCPTLTHLDRLDTPHTESMAHNKVNAIPQAQHQLHTNRSDASNASDARQNNKESQTSADTDSDSDSPDEEPLDEYFKQRLAIVKAINALPAPNQQRKVLLAHGIASSRRDVDEQYQEAVDSQLQSDMLLHDKLTDPSDGESNHAFSDTETSDVQASTPKPAMQPFELRLRLPSSDSTDDSFNENESTPPTSQNTVSLHIDSQEEIVDTSRAEAEEGGLVGAYPIVAADPPHPSRTPTKQTGLKSSHFKPPKSTTPKAKRAPAGTVSCIPFPSIRLPSFGLVQETLAHDPFRLLVALIFLNKTKGAIALPSFWSLMKRYPTPRALADARVADIADMIQHLGLQNSRARTIVALASAWVDDPPQKGLRGRTLHYPYPGAGKDIKPAETLADGDAREGAWEIAHLPGCGRYAFDSWRMFCRDVLRGLAEDYDGKGASEDFQPEWMRVLPQDKELRAFLRWRWLKEGFTWDPETGEKEIADELTMAAAREGRNVLDDAGQVLSGEAMGFGAAKLDVDRQLNATINGAAHATGGSKPPSESGGQLRESDTKGRSNLDSQPAKARGNTSKADDDAAIDQDTSSSDSDSDSDSGSDSNPDLELANSGHSNEEEERPSIPHGATSPATERWTSKDRQSWPSPSDDASFYTAMEDDDGMLYVPESPRSSASDQLYREQMLSPSVKDEPLSARKMLMNRGSNRDSSVEL